jgi:uncharacterized protein (TIGR00369 family)
MKDESDTQRKRSGFRDHIGYGEVELIIGPKHMNSVGIVHGGVYMSMLDVALGHAVSYCTVPGNFRFSTTVSLTTSFLKGAKSGVLTAVGRIDGIQGRLATGTGEVRDEAGDLCAVAQASFLYFPGSERPEGVPKR